MNLPSHIFDFLTEAKANGRKLVFGLVDPDQSKSEGLLGLLQGGSISKLDGFLVGGSFLTKSRIGDVIDLIRQYSKAPVLLFPGHEFQVHPDADGLLLLNLISGRNPEFLIGKHVVAAPMIVESGLEVIPTSYILIDGGRVSSTQYITNTHPIPQDKVDIIVATVLAGALNGHRTTYLEAGSGAYIPIPPSTIAKVAAVISHPLMVGGGIRTLDGVKSAFDAGADVVVLGSILEENPNFLEGL